MTKQGEDLNHYNKQNNRKNPNKLCEPCNLLEKTTRIGHPIRDFPGRFI